MKQLFILYLFFISSSFAAIGDLPHLLPMKTQYIGEDLRKHEPVFYVSDEKIHLYEVVFKDGRLLTLERKNLESYRWELPSIYVITEDQKLYISPFQKHNHFHHSSLTGGKKVLAAGQILVKDGVLLAFDRQSGHYLPTEAHLQFTKEFFEKNGVNTSQAIIGLNTAEENINLLKDTNCLNKALGTIFLD